MKGYNSTTSGKDPDPHAAEAANDTAPSEAHDATLTEPSPANRPNGSEATQPREFGGRKKGLEPTRYGDWEKDGRCIDF